MFETLVRNRLETADIIPHRGDRGDPEVTNPRFWRRVALGGSLALGESYMDGDWSCAELDVFFSKLLEKDLDRFGPVRTLASAIGERLRAAADRRGARKLGEHHYSIGNDLYAAMLGSSMTYTCAYWSGAAQTLESAQEAKMDLICRKLGLHKGMTLLVIGCGWGSLLAYAAQKHGVRGTGITVSSAQAEEAQRRCSGLPVHIILQDYRDVGGVYDRVVSVGMFEHVERRYHRSFMETCRRALKRSGIGLLHTIGKAETSPPDPWIRKYIFPLGDLPTPKGMEAAAQGLLQFRHWHRFGGEHYDRTLMAWYRNYNRWRKAQRLPRTDEERRFYRMWRYYLLACAGGFRANRMDVWQMVFTRYGEQHAVPAITA